MDLDFNRTAIRQKSSNELVNAVVDTSIAASLAGAAPRGYLGASSLGDDCMRKIQWMWTRSKPPEPRTERIFARGRWFETYYRQLMHDAGFRMISSGDRIGFSQLDGKFKGHADGVILSGPDELSYPCLWECKGLGAKGWKKLVTDGLAAAYPTYANQVALYQAYLDLTEHPALFTAANMDTMEVVHLLVPFDPRRAQMASDKALAIVLAEEAGETMPRHTNDPNHFACRWCQFREECWA
jgi:hypothetical protein